MKKDIPLSICHQFHNRQKPYALIVGVYNEGNKFTRQLDALQPYRDVVDIIIADGKSTDGATLPEVLAGKASVLLINTDQQRGLSVQYRIALNYIIEQGYDGCIMMDGNGKDGVNAIPGFIEKLQEGVDFIQGSRFMRGGVHERTPLFRMLGIKLVFNPIMAIATCCFYSDTINGFKGCSRKFLLHPQLQPFRNIFVRYNLQYYLNYRAPKLKVRLCEIPVSRIYREDKMPHTKIIGIKAHLKILAELLNTVTGRYNPR